MKKTLYLSLIIALTALFSSCNKCNKADCQNDASCEKREGICKCTFLYEGEQCENEVRESYVGTYEGSISYPNPDNPFASEESPLTVNVTTRGSSPSDIGINFTFFNTKYELTGQITEEDKFELNEQKMSAEGFGSITILSSSSGSVLDNTVTSNINISLDDFPQFPSISLNFIGTK